MKRPCPWCGNEKEHEDFCPENPKSRKEHTGMPGYMKPRIPKRSK